LITKTSVIINLGYFVAHRKEILQQAKATFKAFLKTIILGFMG
jgi:hypothetical protein